MPFDVKVDILQCNKDDNIKCEDYFKESEHNKDDEDKFYCLCDGASESYDSYIWAKIIANKYLEGKYSNKKDFKADNMSSFMKSCIEEYKDEVEFDSLSWSHQSAFLRGSFSTLLGVSIIGVKLLIFAVGDSIVFKFNRKKNNKYGDIISFPYKKSDDFQTKPTLLSSIINHNHFLDKSDYIKKHTKEWIINSTDILFLMTDAISEWLLKEKKERIDKLMSLFNVNDPDVRKVEFKKFVSEERMSKKLRIDDTTVVKLEFGKMSDELPNS